MIDSSGTSLSALYITENGINVHNDYLLALTLALCFTLAHEYTQAQHESKMRPFHFRYLDNVSRVT